MVIQDAVTVMMIVAATNVVTAMMTVAVTEDLYLTEEIVTLADANVRMTDFPKRKAYLQA